MELERSLLAAFASKHPTQTARAIESLAPAAAAEVVAGTPEDAAAAVLPKLSPLTAARVLALVSLDHAASTLSRTRRDVTAAILRATPVELRGALLDALESEVRRAVEPLLRFSEGTAGALMDPGVLSCNESISVADALQRLRETPSSALYYLYVVNDEQRLVGVVNLRELIEAPSNRRVGLIATRPVESLPVRATSESIVRHPAWKRFHALPVVDARERLVGVVRYELARELEGRFLEQDLGDQSAETAAALGEVYGLGLRGVFEWAASALLGPSDTERGPR